MYYAGRGLPNEYEFSRRHPAKRVMLTADIFLHPLYSQARSVLLEDTLHPGELYISRIRDK